MKIGLLQDRILVKRIEEEETTAGGIIISDAKEKPQEGQIIAVGKRRDPQQGSSRSSMSRMETACSSASLWAAR